MSKIKILALGLTVLVGFSFAFGQQAPMAGSAMPGPMPGGMTGPGGGFPGDFGGQGMMGSGGGSMMRQGEMMGGPPMEVMQCVAEYVKTQGQEISPEMMKQWAASGGPPLEILPLLMKAMMPKEQGGGGCGTKMMMMGPMVGENFAEPGRPMPRRGGQMQMGPMRGGPGGFEGGGFDERAFSGMERMIKQLSRMKQFKSGLKMAIAGIDDWMEGVSDAIAGASLDGADVSGIQAKFNEVQASLTTLRGALENLQGALTGVAGINFKKLKKDVRDVERMLHELEEEEELEGDGFFPPESKKSQPQSLGALPPVPTFGGFSRSQAVIQPEQVERLEQVGLFEKLFPKLTLQQRNILKGQILDLLKGRR